MTTLRHGASAHLAQVARYGMVGIANTATSLAIIWACLAVGWGDYPANACGYAVGLALSFVANRRFTFGRRGQTEWAEVQGFAAAFALSYAANLGVLAAGQIAGLGRTPGLHLAGMAVYSVLFYVLMRGMAFRQSAHASTSGVPITARDVVPLVTLALLAGGSLLLLVGKPLTHDVVWQMWIARQLLAGATLYRDIWEVNPPLWFWSAMPFEWLAGVTGISPFRYLIAAIIALATFAAWATWRLAGPLSTREGVLLVGVAFAAMIWVEPFDFGQREQLALIGAIPYAALAARRRAGGTVPIWLALAVGVLAAYGFALKHYFALIPVLIEGWLFVATRRAGARYNPFRTETIVLALAAAAYLAAVLLVAPDFLNTMVPMVSLAYGGYEEPVRKWFDEPAQLVWGLGAIALLHSHRQPPRARPIELALLLVMTGFAAAYFLQAKGWQYHAMPVTGALLAALAVRLRDLAGIQRVILAIPIATALMVGQIHGSYGNFLRPLNEELIRSAPAGSAVAVFDADPMWAWPTVEENGHAWALNHYSLWMMPTIARAEEARRMTPELHRLAARVRAQALHDLRCSQPAVILFGRTSRYPAQPKGFDVGGFFLDSAPLAGFIAAQYREAAPTTEFRVFRRVANSADQVAGCRIPASPQWRLERHDGAGRLVTTAPDPRG